MCVGCVVLMFAELYAENVRRVMAKAMGVQTSESTFSDVIDYLMQLGGGYFFKLDKKEQAVFLQKNPSTGMRDISSRNSPTAITM